MKHILIALALSLNIFASVTPEQFADTLVLQISPVNTSRIQHFKLSIKENWEKAGGGSALMAILKGVDESEALQLKAIKLVHDTVHQILYVRMDSFLTAIIKSRFLVPEGELPKNFIGDSYMRLFERYVEELIRADALELWHTFLQNKIPTFYESAIPVARKKYEDYLDTLIEEARSELHLSVILS